MGATDDSWARCAGTHTTLAARPGQTTGRRRAQRGKRDSCRHSVGPVLHHWGPLWSRAVHHVTWARRPARSGAIKWWSDLAPGASCGRPTARPHPGGPSHHANRRRATAVSRDTRAGRCQSRTCGARKRRLGEDDHLLAAPRRRVPKHDRRRPRCHLDLVVPKNQSGTDWPRSPTAHQPSGRGREAFCQSIT